MPTNETNRIVEKQPNLAKTIFITGCSSGIGLAAAYYLRDKGFRVITSCRKPEDANKLQQQGFEVVILDLADSKSVQQAATSVLELTQGKLYALLNNAGFGIYGKLEAISRTKLEQQFATNVFGTHELTMLLLPSMLANKQGRIIQISSVLGFISSARRGAYAASKYALEGLTDALRQELHATGVQISLIEPGPIKTSFNQNTEQAALEEVHNSKLAANFTLTPAALMPKIYHALTSKQAKSRYRVTTVAHSMWWARRLLPTKLLDILLRKS